MPKIVYIEANGQRHEADVETGMSVMQGALNFGIPGIDGDCGGACACATCHVYVAAGETRPVPPISDAEKAMLAFALDVTPESRLSCQIEVGPDLDGLEVRLPTAQK
ncbi:MAG: 2Fe-2S iron-sulfur cluster binding domain-containing protein [Alphaproteobacteria bacterium]|nr:2Fe-2S iron-sulfur cluster binding domain-containing protein [Alphaproteobacteria bacterium]